MKSRRDMDIDILNEKLELLGICDEISSLILTRRYFTPGGFQLDVPATKNNLALLRRHRLVQWSGMEETGIITSLRLSKGEEGETITASGCFYEGLLASRIIRKEDGTLAGLIRLNCVDCEAVRRLPSLAMGVMEHIPYSGTFLGKNLGEVTEALCRANNVSVTVRMEDGFLKCVTRRGTGRSNEQEENPHVEFSEEYDNLLSSEYSVSDQGAVSTVYTKLKIPAETRYKTIPSYETGMEAAGLDRWEVLAETDAVTESYTVSEGENAITRYKLDFEKSLANLKAEAEKALFPVTENFEGAVSFDSGYGELFDLGDVVTVFRRDWGLSISQRIYEIEEVYDFEGDRITPVFGSPLKTILDVLKGA